MPVLQLTANNQLRHLLGIDGLTKTHLIQLMDSAQSFFDVKGRLKQTDTLKNYTLANIFFENSTRTRSTFELAAKRLGAQVLNLPINESATSKGESLRDTIMNLKAMQCEFFVIRHPQSGAAHFIAKHLEDHTTVINAGDGRHAHPTQALLDMLTIRQHHQSFPHLKVAIVGDILHSRVARSQIAAMKLLGFSEIRVVAPLTLLPKHIEQTGVNAFIQLEEGIKGVDVIMMLRLQKERMETGLLPSNTSYFQQYGLTKERLQLANPKAIIVHPGPINRGVEIEYDCADSPQAVILNQVTNGVAIRMAVMAELAQQWRKS